MAKQKWYIYPILCITMAVLNMPCLAQKKYEREYRIKENEVPERARNFISSVFKKTKIHWHGEESLTGKSIEAKFKDSGKRYSIEFDESGGIQDIEILSSVGDISSESRATLKENLEKEFPKYKIVKTQLHWNGSENHLKEALQKDKLPKGIVVRYELILKATKNKREAYFEILSEKNGSIVSIKEIVQRNSDNLIY